ncbi:uncharacterized protein LOC129408046 [Boleophthalmus pectinirostris]|uniref:uncharacterized protein LOC129408046 n=1 Tax=Boleophthalmus pectinirostris TaxID=150288 RepID=UPI00242E19E8|nr:uncharacterized protein LOC129408046 [Boleophthalmus pectinirostris]
MLSTEVSSVTWAGLAKVTLTQVILFNRRRSGQVSKMPLSAYMSPKNQDVLEDLGEALSDLEKKLCQHFRRLEIRGKRGRKVPVLLTPAMQESLDLLVTKRDMCGVPQENTYLFARPHAFSCYRGSECLRHFAKACGAKNPDTLTSTKLRKQTATLSQVLNLSNTELDQLADFLGHDVRVHRQFYRLPEGTLQLAKISKVLMALEQGRMAEFKGKGLDDITIDPEDTVMADSDTESQEDVVTISQGEDELGAEVLDEIYTSQETKKAKCEEAVVTPSQGMEVEIEMSDESDTTSQPVKTSKGAWSRKGSQTKSKGVKRRMWDKQEVQAVERHLSQFISSCRVPGKSDCEKCVQLEKDVLKHRDWRTVKSYVMNRITTLKRKVCP